MTRAEKVFSSAKINKLINELVQEIAINQNEIKSIKAPDEDKKDSYKASIDYLNQIRGRNLFYSYIGSGMGHGPYVELQDGSVKIDLINGIGIHLMGHGHQGLIASSLKGALQDVIMQGNLQPNGEYGELLDTLIKTASKGSRLKKGWIGTCGTIVNENALKIARQKNSPARKIIAMRNAFAGRSTLMAEITDNPEYRVGLPAYDEVLYVPFFDKHNPNSIKEAVAEMRKHIESNPKNIACFVFELLQGEGGFNYAPPEFFKPLFELCREHHIAIWADEVQTFMRTGQPFAFQTLGLGEYIDIVTIAKTIQCGAILYTEEYNPKPGLIAGTFTAATVSLAAGNAVLKHMLSPENKMMGPGGRIEKIHNEFTSMLKSLKAGSCKDLIQDIEGLGLMVAMTPYDGTKDKVMKLLQILFQNGVMAFSCGHGPYKLRFLLPVVLETKHIEEIKVLLEKSLKQGATA